MFIPRFLVLPLVLSLGVGPLAAQSMLDNHEQPNVPPQGAQPGLRSGRSRIFTCMALPQRRRFIKIFRPRGPTGKSFLMIRVRLPAIRSGAIALLATILIRIQQGLRDIPPASLRIGFR